MSKLIKMGTINGIRAISYFNSGCRDLHQNRLCCEDKGIQAPIITPAGVEVTHRSKAGRNFVFLLNHNADEVIVKTDLQEAEDLLTGEKMSGLIKLAPKGVRIIAIKK